MSNCQFIFKLTQHVQEKNCHANSPISVDLNDSKPAQDVAADAGKPADGGDPGAHGFRIHALL